MGSLASLQEESQGDVVSQRRRVAQSAHHPHQGHPRRRPHWQRSPPGFGKFSREKGWLGDCGSDHPAISQNIRDRNKDERHKVPEHAVRLGPPLLLLRAIGSAPHPADRRQAGVTRRLVSGRDPQALRPVRSRFCDIRLIRCRRCLH